MSLVDVSTLDESTRLQAAEAIRTMTDFELGQLDYFNNQPCIDHNRLELGCRRCGVNLRKHQRVGVAWLYMRGKGLIADQVGTGKTAQAAGLIAAATQAGEYDNGEKIIVVCRPSALPQWARELERFLPSHHTITATGTAAQRRVRYQRPWHILVTGYQMYARDVNELELHCAHTLIVDDVDALRNRRNQTAYHINRLAKRCPRVIVLNGTPLQKHLTELYAMLTPVGAGDVFGSQTYFTRRYVREEFVKVYNTSIGRHVTTRKAVGYQNLDEFIAKATPLTLRRTPAHIDDVDLPVIQPHDVYLDLHPAQKAKYDELRKGVLKVVKAEGGTRISQPDAMAMFLYGQQICSGLVTLGEADRKGTSSKLDYVEQLLTGDLAEEKVVVFCQFTRTVEALQARLSAADVKHVTIWGRDTRPASRAAAQTAFWDDPDVKVLIGTTAIEQSLNLQVSRFLINVDQIINPARMQQLAGRIRRDGSRYKSVYVVNLFARGTQEEGYLDVLRREQALADFVFGESNQLFEALSPLALLDLIGHSGG